MTNENIGKIILFCFLMIWPLISICLHFPFTICFIVAKLTEFSTLSWFWLFLTSIIDSIIVLLYVFRRNGD